MVLSQQVGNGDTHGFCKYLQSTQGDVSLTPLHRTNICSMKTTASGKFFLRKILSMTIGLNVLRQYAG